MHRLKYYRFFVTGGYNQGGYNQRNDYNRSEGGYRGYRGDNYNRDRDGGGFKRGGGAPRGGDRGGKID